MANKRSGLDIGHEIRRTGQLSGIQVLFAAILGIGLILTINFSSRITESQPLQEAYERVRAEIDDLREEQATLTALRDYVRTDAYVEEWAASEGKMVRPNEVLVVLFPGSVVLEETPVPQIPIEDIQTIAPPPENWTMWWALFFDSPPPVFD